MTVQTIQVSNASGLISALAAATGGETINLAPGNYGSVYLNRYNFAQAVTINGGTFSDLQVFRSSGMNFEGTTVNFVPSMTSTTNSQGISVYIGDRINFNNVTLVGGPSINGVDPSSTWLDSSGNVLGLPVGKGINFDYVTNASITNSDISLFAKGITVSHSGNIVIDNNDIHNLRTTPISGSVTSNLVITNNHTWDSHPWNFGGSGDHGDRIHIWTDKTPITGLVISNNYLDQGAGDAMLGIYLDDNGLNLGFPDAVITGNTLVDGAGQGFVFEKVSGTVANNTLIWSGTGPQVNNTPRFYLGNSQNIDFTDNVGDVTIYTGSKNLNFVRQTGYITEQTTMSAADRDTITIDDTVITARNSYVLDATTTYLRFEGGTGDFVGTGNALANKITGSGGNDTLTGNGGADTLNGGSGNDTYIIDNSAQIILDSYGIDHVKSRISWTLQTGLENLTYTGTAAATLAGNNLVNTIIGGNANDRLIGNGGADSLQGGLGNDVYVLDNTAQKVVDTGGTDTIESKVTWTLQTGIENLTLIGTGNINANGNTGANVITGNAGNNILDGKTGADTMLGGAGNDTYLVDTAGDKATEVVGGVDAGGVDIVKTGLASFTLAAGIETLTYTGTTAFAGSGSDDNNTITGGASTDTLRGLAGDDKLVGNAGNDSLDGGAGADTLTGGTGNDTYVFTRGESNGDNIIDFNGLGTSAGDVIELRGWGAGTTVSRVATSNYWLIKDGIDGYEEYITSWTIDQSDIVLTQGMASTSANTS
ncbi:MAG: beta strand repeat-containing protein, partial [Polymorphobacter sp.]